MLSISGTTLEQFADLMRGLGYKAEAGERPKVKAVTEVVPTATEVPADRPVMDAGETPAAGAVTEEGAEPIEDAPIAEVSETETPVGEAADAVVTPVEMEIFYTFTWARPARRQQPAGGERPKGKGKPNPRGKKGQRDGDKGNKSQNFSARPPKPEKKIDPDNPFAAALMGLKNDK